jgi:3'-phosphoadenosine 5'-phosphosulfate sulfotransferase
LTRTFYTSQARPRRRIGGAEDGAVDVRSGPFRRRTILRARATGGGERDRPAGKSEHTDRASDLLRRERERERERVLLSEQEWPSFCGERASGVERIRNRHIDEITTCVSDVRKKATLGANQRRRILQACVSSTNLSIMDFIAHYQYGSYQ